MVARDRREQLIGRFVVAVGAIVGLNIAQGVGIAALGQSSMLATVIAGASTGTACGVLLGGLAQTEGEPDRGERSSPIRRRHVPMAAIIALIVGMWVALVPIAELPIWFAVLNAAVTSVVVLGAGPLGRRMNRRRPRPEHSTDSWSTFSLTEKRRAARRAAITMCVVAVAALAVLIPLSAPAAADPGIIDTILDVGSLVLLLVALAGSIAVQVTGWALQLRIRDAVGDEPVRRARITRVVTRGVGALADGDHPRAARFAAVYPAHQRLTVVGLLGLMIASASSVLAQMGRSSVPDAALAIFAVVGFGGALVLLLVTRRRIRRAERYAREHADLLGDADPVDPAPPVGGAR